MKLGDKMSAEFIQDMIERFKNGKLIHKKYAYQIVIQAKELFSTEPTMPEITVEPDHKLTICGDTHGNLKGLLPHHLLQN